MAEDEGKYRPVHYKGYSKETREEICRRIAEGESVRQITKDDHMPSRNQVWVWINKIPGFREDYYLAKEMCADVYAEEVLDIADDGTNDWMQSTDPENPGYKLNGEHVNRSRLRVDTRKWVMARMSRRRYGDASKTEISGPDGGAIETNVNINFVPVSSKKSD